MVRRSTIPRMGRMGWAALLLAASPAVSTYAQRPDTLAVESQIEAALEAAVDESGDPTQLAEWLDALRTTPLDLNEATHDELAQLPTLGPLLAQAIVRYRARHGPFLHIEDLLRVESLTPGLVAGVRPFITVEPPRQATRVSLRETLRGLQTEVIGRGSRRLDVGRGYAEDTTRVTYAGTPERIYTRLRAWTPDHVAAGLVLEKDPGEPYAWAPEERQFGLDHVAGYVALQDLGRLRMLIVGDYVTAFGQGLALWRSSGFGKGREPIRPVLRTGRGLRPFVSTEENRFFRGAAATVRLTAALHLSAFASTRSLDARLAAALPEPDAAFEELTEASAFSRSGLHRTPTERQQRDAVQERLAGGVLEWTGTALRGGVASDRSFRPNPAPYQRFAFRDRRATMLSTFGSLTRRLVHGFGEVTRASNGAVAGLGGLHFRPSGEVGLLLLARHYPRDFVSLHGYGFGERNGITQNETGFYLGLDTQLTHAWRLSAYVDQYRFPWVRFDTPRPGTGYDALVLLEFHPRRWLTVYAQGRTETKEVGTTSPGPEVSQLDALRAETRQSLRLHGDYAFSARVRLRARLERVRFATPGAVPRHGLLLYQEIRWQPTPVWQVDARVAFFDTDSFNARVFAYEQDVLYTFSVPSFSGQGQRGYVVLRWRPRRALLVQVKASATRFEHITEVGSGLDTVAGNRLREVRVLVRIRP